MLVTILGYNPSNSFAHTPSRDLNTLIACMYRYTSVKAVEYPSNINISVAVNMKDN